MKTVVRVFTLAAVFISALAIALGKATALIEEIADCRAQIGEL